MVQFSARLAVVFLAALIYAGGHQTAVFPEQVLVVCEKEETRAFSDNRGCEEPVLVEPFSPIAEVSERSTPLGLRRGSSPAGDRTPKPFSTGPPVA